MRIIGIKLFTVLIVGFVIFGCNKSSEIGQDIIDQDIIGISFDNSTEMDLSLEKIDSIVTRTGADYLLLGQISEPLFGKSKASAFIQFVPDVSPPRFDSLVIHNDLVLDSVVMILPQKENFRYGINSLEQKISVYRLNEEIPTDLFYSNHSIEYDEISIGEKIFISSLDSMYVGDYKGDSLIYIPSQIRIPLDNAMFLDLFDTDSVFTSGSKFIESVPGFYITPEFESDGFSSISVPNSIINIYYNYNDTIKEIYSLHTTSSFFHANKFEKDISETVIEDYYDDDTLLDSLIFFEGINGNFVKIDLLDVQRFSGNIINDAELEITVDKSAIDVEAYSVPKSLYLFLKDDNGDFQSIEDVTQSTTTYGELITEGEESNSKYKYRLKITSVFQDMIDGQTNPQLFISIPFRALDASRTVFYGPNRNEDPIKLNVIYTPINP